MLFDCDGYNADFGCYRSRYFASRSLSKIFTSGTNDVCDRWRFCIKREKVGDDFVYYIYSRLA